MRNNFILLLLFLLTGSFVYGQSPDRLMNEAVIPESALSVKLDLGSIENALLSLYDGEELELDLPIMGASEETFVLSPYQVMEPSSQSRFPHIRAFKGHLKSDKSQRLYISSGDYGIKGLFHNNEEMFLLQTQGDNLISYAQAEIPMVIDGVQRYHCDADHEIEEDKHEHSDIKRNEIFKAGEEYPLLQYRIAIATTGEFSNKYGGTESSVMSEVVSIMNKVNFVYNRDVGINLVIIDGTERLFFYDPNTDAYDNGNTGQMLSVNQGVIRGEFSPNQYDVGHAFGTRGGGLARRPSVCRDDKELGVSCQFGVYNDEDFYMIVSHELGHQFSAPHTFNYCGDNESPGTAYEPGSGNTIMSYSGAGCAAWNLPINDPFFHINSIELMYNYTRINGLGRDCAREIETDNECPEIQDFYEDGFYIPISTAFELTGKAGDANNDNLTYSWEQYDLGPEILVEELPYATSPFFMYFPPSESPTRVFPEMSLVLSGRLKEKLQYTPDTTRPFNFRFTVRDNNDEVGATVWDQVSFWSSAEAGPFSVVFPNNNGDTLYAGSANLIEWDPANTFRSPVNCPLVDIMINTDPNGFEYEDTLLTQTPNDGRAIVELPASEVGTRNRRVKVKCSDNIFFAISRRGNVVGEATQPNVLVTVEPEYKEICLPEMANFVINTASIAGYDKPLQVDYSINISSGVTLSLEKDEINPGESISLDLAVDNSISGDTIRIDVELSNDTEVFNYPLTVVATSNDFSDLSLVEPANAAQEVAVNTDFSWKKSKAADSYLFEIATNASFREEFVVFSKTTLADEIIAPITLAPNSVYFWRAIPQNKCGSPSFFPVNAFMTTALRCTDYTYDGPEINIGPGVSSSETTLTVTETGTINDVNLKNITGSHGLMSQVTAQIRNPDGVLVELWSRQCANRTTINASFDDQANDPDFDCLKLTNTGEPIRPMGQLSDFNAGVQEGNWSLIMIDSVSGIGGSLESYTLELCASYTPIVPSLSRNELLTVMQGEQKDITTDFLYYEHPNIASNKVIVQVTEEPKMGQLKFTAGPNETDINAGSSPNMSHFENNFISYAHSGVGSGLDSFKFVVYNSDGGLLNEMQTFYIQVQGVSTQENSLGTLRLFPNPTSLNSIKITLEEPISALNSISMFSVDGSEVSSSFIKNGQSIQLSWPTGQASGVYFIQVRTNKGVYTNKVILQ